MRLRIRTEILRILSKWVPSCEDFLPRTHCIRLYIACVLYDGVTAVWEGQKRGCKGVHLTGAAGVRVDVPTGMTAAEGNLAIRINMLSSRVEHRGRASRQRCVGPQFVVAWHELASLYSMARDSRRFVQQICVLAPARPVQAQIETPIACIYCPSTHLHTHGASIQTPALLFAFTVHERRREHTAHAHVNVQTTRCTSTYDTIRRNKLLPNASLRSSILGNPPFLRASILERSVWALRSTHMQCCVERDCKRQFCIKLDCSKAKDWVDRGCAILMLLPSPFFLLPASANGGSCCGSGPPCHPGGPLVAHCSIALCTTWWWEKVTA